MSFSSLRPLVIPPIAFLCFAAVPNSVPRLLESPAAKTVSDLLQSSNAEQIATVLEYPPTYTLDQLAQDRKGIGDAVNYLIGQFGRITNVKPLKKQVTFLEIGITGGPAPFWWQTGTESETRQYIYEVEFGKYGPGFLKVLTHITASRELPVGFAFGLNLNSHNAQSRARAAMGGLMDLMGLPNEHPARSIPIPTWEAPAIAD